MQPLAEERPRGARVEGADRRSQAERWLAAARSPPPYPPRASRSVPRRSRTYRRAARSCARRPPAPAAGETHPPRFAKGVLRFAGSVSPATRRAWRTTPEALPEALPEGFRKLFVHLSPERPPRLHVEARTARSAWLRAGLVRAGRDTADAAAARRDVQSQRVELPAGRHGASRLQHHPEDTVIPTTSCASSYRCTCTARRDGSALLGDGRLLLFRRRISRLGLEITNRGTNP